VHPRFGLLHGSWLPEHTNATALLVFYTLHELARSQLTVIRSARDTTIANSRIRSRLWFSLGFISPLPGPETRSTSSPFPVTLGRPPCLGAIQVAALLDMARVCRNDGIGHTQKTLRDDSSHLEAIKVFLPHLP
jgi:hypothetical protein